MIRIFLQYILPFILPIVIYILWVIMARKADKQGRKEFWPILEDGVWFWLIALGFLLAISSLVYFGINDGADPNSKYIPPVFKDGKIVPGRIIKK